MVICLILSLQSEREVGAYHELGKPLRRAALTAPDYLGALASAWICLEGSL